MLLQPKSCDWLQRSLQWWLFFCICFGFFSKTYKQATYDTLPPFAPPPNSWLLYHTNKHNTQKKSKQPLLPILYEWQVIHLLSVLIWTINFIFSNLMWQNIYYCMLILQILLFYVKVYTFNLFFFFFSLFLGFGNCNGTHKPFFFGNIGQRSCNNMIIYGSMLSNRNPNISIECSAYYACFSMNVYLKFESQFSALIDATRAGYYLSNFIFFISLVF